MHHHGYTLLELLTALFVLVTLLTIGVPALRHLVLDTQRTANVNAFVTAVQLARSESAKRATPVTLCKSSNGVTCGGTGVHFEHGWIAFSDPAGTPPPVDGIPLLRHRPVGDVTIRSNRPQFTFRPWHRRSTNGTVAFCDGRGSVSARAVVVSYTGRPRVAEPESGAVDCPD